MNSLKPYSYVLLRYVPDAVTGEAMNAGLVLYSSSEQFLMARVSDSISRLSHAFPGIDGFGLKRVLGWIQTSINKHGKRLPGKSRALFDVEPRSAAEFAYLHFPKDDSALQWSEQRVGLTADPRKEFERLYRRLVTGFNRMSERSTRSDNDVWFQYSKAFDQVGLSVDLKEHTVAGDIEPYRFEHAFKNGIWHCLEPLSFDLAMPESIKSKARDKFAAMSFIEPAAQDLKVYFLIGTPSNTDSMQATEIALKMLEKSPVKTEIVLETSAQDLATRLVAMVH